MVHRFSMPRLTQTMDEGTLTRWLKAEGERVSQGEVLCEIETDKSVVEVPSPVSGVVRRLLAAPGEVAQVGQVLALITDTADEPLEGEPPHGAGQTEEVAAVAAAGALPAAPSRPRASPLARRLAEQLGVDLRTVTGTGPDGLIVEADVRRAHAQAAPGAAAVAAAPAAVVAASAKPAAAATAPASTVAPAPSPGVRSVPLTRMRAAIARSMTASAAIPQFNVTREVDVTGLLQLHAATAGAIQRVSGQRPSLTDFLVQAVARVLLRHPYLNATFERREPLEQSVIHLHPEVHVGLAVAVEEGLIVPVIRSAQRKSVAELAGEREALVEAARQGRLTAPQVTGATFTISNLGPMRADQFVALVNPPEVAILAVGRAREVARRSGEGVVWRQVMTLTLSVDHRAADGAQAAAFLDDLASFIEGGSEWDLLPLTHRASP